MSKLVDILTKVLAIVGGISGPWGAYTAYDALKFKQPFDEHDQVAKSYLAQITSAEKRNDKGEVTRIRLLYETYEEKWRAARRIAQIVAPIESLATVFLTPEESSHLNDLLVRTAEGPTNPWLSPKTLGAAYLATKDFKSAAAQLSVAAQGSKDPNALALKAAAYSELASRATDPRIKSKYEITAAESYTAALKMKSISAELTGFAYANPSLKAALDHQGIKVKDL